MPAPYGRRLTLLLAMCITAGAIACGSSTATGTTGPSTGGTPAHIVKVSGDSQHGTWDAVLPAPLIVKVTDSSGNPVTNASVAWAMTFDDAPLHQMITTTNASGQTQVDPTPVGSPGAYSINAGINAGSVTFTGSGNVALVPGWSTFANNLFANCGLTKQGIAFCWGSGYYGQLGAPDSGAHVGPVPVVGGYEFTQVSVGNAMACGIATTGALYCWGSPAYSGFGNGTPAGGATIYTPVAAGNGRKFSASSVQQSLVCGISSSAAYCWGSNSDGAVGNGNTTDQWSPAAVATPGGVTFTTVQAGWNYACALASTGDIYCWGGNSNGVLGTGSSSPDSSSVPLRVTGGHSFVALGVGSIGVCGLTSAGTVYCWGEAINGNGTSTKEFAPTAISQSGLTFTQLSVEGVLACALTGAGAAYCWGSNDHGSLGSGSYSSSGLTPSAVTGGLTFSYVGSGGVAACGLTTSHATYCWGTNTLQQLGLAAGADSMYDSPQLVPGMSGGS